MRCVEQSTFNYVRDRQPSCMYSYFCYLERFIYVKSLSTKHILVYLTENHNKDAVEGEI